MKEEQDKLEKRLWEEREDVRRSHEEKVKVAKTKCAHPSSQSFLLLTLLQGKDDWSWPVGTRGTGNRPCAAEPHSAEIRFVVVVRRLPEGAKKV
jgi:hypothetical protein